MWNRLISVVEEQAQTLLRTRVLAHRSRGRRLVSGRLRPPGRMLAQAVTGTPGT